MAISPKYNIHTLESDLIGEFTYYLSKVINTCCVGGGVKYIKITFLICVWFLWIHKGYFEVEKLVLHVGIKALLYVYKSIFL